MDDESRHLVFVENRNWIDFYYVFGLRSKGKIRFRYLIFWQTVANRQRSSAESPPASDIMAAGELLCRTAVACKRATGYAVSSFDSLPYS